jgi:hypothetical protein
MSNILIICTETKMNMKQEIELRHLRYFLVVAETLHFSKAAAQLGMAQPPLSQQIRSLERILGYPLFNRTTRGVRLTKVGQYFREGARNTLTKLRGSLGIHRQTPCRITPNSIPRTESCWSSWRASNAHPSPYFTGCYRLPGLVSTASAAESFRSRCGSVRGAPVCSSQA